MDQWKGALALGKVADKTEHLDMACSRCDRKGHYETARLVRKFGADFPMTELASAMSTCPKRNNTAAQDRCDVYFPGLSKLMNGDAAR